MEQGTLVHPIAVVVEDDIWQREELALLLEQSEMDVVKCDSAERALRALAKFGERISTVVTDVNLAGKIDGVELAHFVRDQHPNVHMIVTSGVGLPKSLPEGATFLPKALRPLDVLREAQHRHH
jgi:DNA-binding NtrC family response regulator